MTKKLEMEFWNDVPGVGPNAAAQVIAVTVADLVYRGLDENLDTACRDLAKGEPTDLLKEVVFDSVDGAGVCTSLSTPPSRLGEQERLAAVMAVREGG